ncbi:hypothetical protein IIE26_27255 (plasmid) [Cytobacillus oceanisediminis]|uniref:hypothetical protein n=1 Tax=Cytobacillus oceanisediminis TaxID=665099 RepID=UPI001865174F|nr:hypothetical protein [Cytobacillus oceanisediminis]QOK30069.1 hypothetical protein IIE26_27255 [Cytobacillus oceanisediminis]
MKMTKKTVSLEMKPLQVVVSVPEGATDKDILELAKEEAVTQLKTKFPAVTYLITAGTTLSLEECVPGRVIRYKEEIGGIFEVKANRKFPVSIFLSGGRKLNIKPVGLEAVNNESLIGSVNNERLEYMKEANEWTIGDTAYIPVGDKVKRVVISKVTKSQINASELSIEGQRKYFTLKANQYRLLCDTENEAKSFLRK